jgi:hypothetical protein
MTIGAIANGMIFKRFPILPAANAVPEAVCQAEADASKLHLLEKEWQERGIRWNSASVWLMPQADRSVVCRFPKCKLDVGICNR